MKLKSFIKQPKPSFQYILRMTVDVFGRSLNTSASVGPPGKPGVGFKTTKDGHYDLDAKKVCNIGDATELNDAVNLSVLKTSMDDVGIKINGSVIDYCETRIYTLEHQLRTEIGLLRKEVQRMNKNDDDDEAQRKVSNPTSSPQDSSTAEEQNANPVFDAISQIFAKSHRKPLESDKYQVEAKKKKKK